MINVCEKVKQSVDSSGCVDIWKPVASVREGSSLFCQSVVSQIAQTFSSVCHSATHNFSSETRGRRPAFPHLPTAHRKHRCIGTEAQLTSGLTSPVLQLTQFEVARCNSELRAATTSASMQQRRVCVCWQEDGQHSRADVKRQRSSAVEAQAAFSLVGSLLVRVLVFCRGKKTLQIF